MRGMRTLDVRVRAQAKTAAMPCRAAHRPSGGGGGALSRAAAASRPRRRAAADGGRLRRHVFHAHQAGRAGGDRGCRPGRIVEAGDLARRRREPDRASRLDRGRGLALSGRSVAVFLRPGKLPTSFISTSRARWRLSRMKPVAVAIVCKTPIAGRSKTRLSPPLRPEECAAHFRLLHPRPCRHHRQPGRGRRRRRPRGLYAARLGSGAAAAAAGSLRPHSARRGRSRRAAVAGHDRSPGGRICRRHSGQFGFADVAEGDLCGWRSMPCAQATTWCSAPPATAATR